MRFEVSNTGGNQHMNQFEFEIWDPAALKHLECGVGVKRRQRLIKRAETAKSAL
jgi:hypothetical protein